MNAPDRDFATRHLGKVIRSLAGLEANPRGDQIDAVAAVIQPQSRVLVVQATGWGKSAVYWAATSALRELGHGPTLVISPLLALMRNQVDAAVRAGLSAKTINSANLEEWDEVYRMLRNDEVDVLLISPERLGNQKFASQLEGLLSRVGLVVIDEAHCISDWGFDFRPDYQRLARMLLSTPTASVLATTATANARVTRDVGEQMGTNTVVFRGTLARTSLRLAVVAGLRPLDRFAWVAQTLSDMPGSGIIYVLTVKEAERLAEFLQKAGFQCEAYTGQLDTETRLQIETALLHNEIKVVVATSALGMGYDKPDLAFCIHVGSPSNPVAYYQQVGRAGRGLEDAVAVLLPSDADEKVWEFFATASIPRLEDITAVLSALAERPKSIIELGSETSVRRGRLETLLKILDVDGIVIHEASKWAVTGKKYTHDHKKWAELEKSRADEAELMRNFAHGRGCLMEFLQRSLDDPDPGPCGRCSVCTGIAPGAGVQPDRKWLQLAHEFSRGVEVEIEARKRWPSGTRFGSVIRGLAAGRAVAFADDPGWSEYFEIMHNSEFRIVPTELLDATVQVLTRWSNVWDERPTWVMPAPAHGAQGSANRVIAAHVATIGKRPLVEPFVWTGGTVPSGAHGRGLVEHLDSSIALVPGVEIPEGPVLLCSVTLRSGWTSAVVAQLLNEVQRGPVLPLAVHQLP